VSWVVHREPDVHFAWFFAYNQKRVWSQCSIKFVHERLKMSAEFPPKAGSLFLDQLPVLYPSSYLSLLPIEASLYAPRSLFCPI